MYNSYDAGVMGRKAGWGGDVDREGPTGHWLSEVWPACSSAWWQVHTRVPLFISLNCSIYYMCSFVIYFLAQTVFLKSPGQSPKQVLQSSSPPSLIITLFFLSECPLQQFYTVFIQGKAGGDVPHSPTLVWNVIPPPTGLFLPVTDRPHSPRCGRSPFRARSPCLPSLLPHRALRETAECAWGARGALAAELRVRIYACF